MLRLHCKEISEFIQSVIFIVLFSCIDLKAININGMNFLDFLCLVPVTSHRKKPLPSPMK